MTMLMSLMPMDISPKRSHLRSASQPSAAMPVVALCLVLMPHLQHGSKSVSAPIVDMRAKRAL